MTGRLTLLAPLGVEAVARAALQHGVDGATAAEMGLSEWRELGASGVQSAKLVAALVSAAVGYGFYRRAAWAWLPGLVLSCLCAGMVALTIFTGAGIGFSLIPNETVQLLYAAVFVVNAAILVWIKRVFEEVS